MQPCRIALSARATAASRKQPAPAVNRPEERRAQCHQAAGEQQRQEHHDLHGGDHQQVQIAEGDGARLDADAQVIRAVRHRIESIVDPGPDHGGEHQHPAHARHEAELGGKSHRHGPAEAQAQVQLRYRKEALEQRIGDGQAPRPRTTSRTQALLSCSTSRNAATTRTRRTAPAPRSASRAAPPMAGCWCGARADRCPDPSGR